MIWFGPWTFGAVCIKIQIIIYFTVSHTHTNALVKLLLVKPKLFTKDEKIFVLAQNWRVRFETIGELLKSISNHRIIFLYIDTYVLNKVVFI